MTRMGSPHLARRLPGARRQWEAMKIQPVPTLEIVTLTGLRQRSATLGGTETEPSGSWSRNRRGKLLVQEQVGDDLFNGSPNSENKTGQLFRRQYSAQFLNQSRVRQSHGGLLEFSGHILPRHTADIPQAR